jgi:hypothetical protein
MKIQDLGWKVALSLFFLFCCSTGLIIARSAGAPTAHTGDFGEPNCTQCHTGNAVNTAGGSVTLTGFPATYTPGQTYPITVTVQRSGQSRWGFQLAVRAVGSALQAGNLAVTDGNAQIVVANAIQYATHTSAGTQVGATSGTWTLNWTAPSPAVGQVRFSVAGNAANNSGTNQGDFIYTNTASSDAASVSLPVTALFAQVAVGGGFTTSFTLINTGSTALSGTIYLTDKAGSPMTVNLSDGATTLASPTFPVSIAPGGSKYISATPLTSTAATATGWARLESNGGTVSGVASFKLSSGTTTNTVVSVLSAETVDNATIPYNDDASALRYTGFAVANPSTTDTVTIKIVTVKEDGTGSTTLGNVTLKPGEQLSRFFAEYAGAGQVFKGTAVLMGQGKKFSVVALLQDQNDFAAIPVVAGKAPGIN